MNTNDPDLDSSPYVTVAFLEKAFPDPQPKNFHTQLGVHFEEIAEMFEAIEGKNTYIRNLLADTETHLKVLAEYLKKSDDAVRVTYKVDFLDSLCDQMVTAVGTGYMIGMDVAGGFGEVNRSNNSKFGLDGMPIYDKNLKMTKGPNYKKPNLEPFI